MEKVDNLEVTQKELYDEVINPIREGKEEMKFQDFKDKYGDQLSPYADLMKYTENEGEDFDLYRDAYNRYKDTPEENMDETMEVFSEKLAERFDGLRSQLGIDPEADIEVKSDAEGQTEVEIKEDEATSTGEVTEVPAEPEEVKEEKTEEITDKNLHFGEGSEAVPEEEEYDEAQDLEELRKAKKNIYE